MSPDDRTAKADSKNTNAEPAPAQGGQGGPHREQAGWRADPVLAQALAWLDEGRQVALATVTRTWGSAPRRAGSHMAVSDGGDFAGSVSGGCIESAVIQAALEVIESGTGRTLEFGVTNEMAWEVGLACGGRVHLYVERVDGTPARGAQREAGAVE